MMASMKDELDHRFDQFLKQAHSMKKIMKAEDEGYAQFQNEMKSMKTMMKFRGQKTR
jgi:hypothetical protein